MVGIIVLVPVLVSGVLLARSPVWEGPGTALGNLEKIGDFIASETASTCKFAGCSAVMGLQAHRSILEPFGGAPFTFTPRWSEARCRRFGGINTGMLIQALDQRVLFRVRLQGLEQ